jgi:hypothetical protein
MGVLGVALGTLIPAVLISFIFWPQYLCKLLNMSTIGYMRDAWLRPVAAMVPFIFVCYWAERHWLPTKLGWFVLQTGVLLPVVALGACIVFRKDVPSAWRMMKRQA